MTDARRPLHLVAFLGLSTCVYSVSLAAVTAFQSGTDAAAVADRAPVQVALDGLSSRNDALEASSTTAGDAFDRATGAYDRVGRTIAQVEAQLADLAKTVGKVNGAAKALPGKVALPSIVRAPASVKAPAVHATTGASGG
jgi:hypothetical protein